MSAQTKTSWIAYGVLLVAAVALLLSIALPMWKPLFVAAVLAGVLKGVNEWLSGRFGGRRRLAASIMTVAVVLLLLLPFAALMTVIVRQALDAYAFVRDTLQEGGFEALAGKLPDNIEGFVLRVVDELPIDPEVIRAQAATGGRLAANLLGDAVGVVTNLLFSLAMFLVAFFALLVDGHRLVHWIERISPLPGDQTSELITRFRLVSRSVIGSSMITAAAQGGTAAIGYLIAGVPNPAFFGLVTFFASFLPSVGTAIVAYPLAGLLLLLGKTWQAIFLAAWAAAVVGLVDNLLKPILIRGGVQIHGVVIFFSLIGGVLVFGAIGLLVGPLAVSFFLAVVRFGQRDFAPEEPDASADDGGPEEPPPPEVPSEVDTQPTRPERGQ